MVILLTGFNAFGGLKVNPSQLIIEELAKRNNDAGRSDLITEILPTTFDEAGYIIQRLIRNFTPNAVICLGVNSNLLKIAIERIALNFDNTETPDNAGKIIINSPIIIDGPPLYESTLPVELMYKALNDSGIPAEISNFAGTYVCNHVFYLARHIIETISNKILCGFIHVPLINEQIHTSGEINGVPFSIMVTAIETCINLIRNSLETPN